MKYGSDLVNEEKYLGLEVPSVLMPQDSNIILNTQHPLFSKIEIEDVMLLEPDNRLLK
jgi:RES domain-containing protein